MKRKFTAIDLFSGCGGLSQGMIDADFEVIASVEINSDAIKAYSLNHPNTTLIQQDIREIDTKSIKRLLKRRPLHLLAGCPPCQGFSKVRKLNRKDEVFDVRNDLVLEYFRFVKELMPITIMMENVPGLETYDVFIEITKELQALGYKLDIQVVNVKDYGVPQSRERLVMVGSLIGAIKIAPGTGEKKTVRDYIEKLESISETTDALHKIVAVHTPEVLNRIKLTPKNGGSRKDLPEEYTLDCHKKPNVGFNDIYGRLRWDDYSTTITGGCLNPSKGRFLHPEEDRVITPREAALLQSFPPNYKFPLDIPKAAIALLIGNALPPKFSYQQCDNLKSHLKAKLTERMSPPEKS
ncbi:DNA cytosine methyltransferase [Spirosoma fluviale]|uniref:DNA (cytosine-5-)-methyltransferase n=1 Tax=Spirosoma fluviale TaxID=1597977 RepID=A0A286F5E5_9BACT|nr:DNA cytosine methyltransferase [Spirosoma fluviale]SOD78326.1 DNA (cytosine-5)-methyltransferase 1 [Spirosoma fluviale]